MKEFTELKKRFQTAWGIKRIGFDETRFIERFAITPLEFLEIWQKSLSRMFIGNSETSRVFRLPYQTIPVEGGILFEENEYRLLSQCSYSIGDQYLIVAEDDSNRQNDRILLKIPVDTTWSELMEGGDLSFDIFDRPIRNYFVFTNSEAWGKYAGNDFDPPLDTYGFKDSSNDHIRKLKDTISSSSFKSR